MLEESTTQTRRK